MSMGVTGEHCKVRTMKRKYKITSIDKTLIIIIIIKSCSKKSNKRPSVSRDLKDEKIP